MLEKIARAREILEILKMEFGNFISGSGSVSLARIVFGCTTHSNSAYNAISRMLEEKYGETLTFACGCTRLVIVDEKNGLVVKLGKHGSDANMRECRRYKEITRRSPRLKKYLAWCEGFEWEGSFVVVMEYIEPHAFIWDSYDGRDKFREMVTDEVWKMLKENDLDNDLHEGNWGCVHGVPVLIDYA